MNAEQNSKFNGSKKEKEKKKNNGWGINKKAKEEIYSLSQSPEEKNLQRKQKHTC